MTAFVVATIKEWNITAYHASLELLPGDWTLISERAELTVERLNDLQPKFVFFPHWSWIVPADITEHFTCICFHMTDLPFGRGGSPLQNLIARGFSETVISALRMTDELDAGPIYLKRPLSLHGSAKEIYARAATEIFEMIQEVIAQDSEPQPQNGKVTVFPRRTPAQSRLPEATDLVAIYDHIRMLDADTYPRAFVDFGLWRLEFSNASLGDDQLTVQATLSHRKDCTDD